MHRSSPPGLCRAILPGMRSVIVHSLPQALAAVTVAAELGRPILLWSPPWGAQSLGIGYFLAMVAAARRAVPAAEADGVIDCGDAPGLALAAMRAGARAVRVTAPADALAGLADIAEQAGVSLMAEFPADGLNLGTVAASHHDVVRAFLVAQTSDM